MRDSLSSVLYELFGTYTMNASLIMYTHVRRGACIMQQLLHCSQSSRLNRRAKKFPALCLNRQAEGRKEAYKIQPAKPAYRLHEAERNRWSQRSNRKHGGRIIMANSALISHDSVKPNSSSSNPTYNFTLRAEDVQAIGTTFKVVFADEGSSTHPVIVCIHGAPATHKAYRHIVQGLTSRGYRVIIPNLPGMGLTALDPDGVYNHTTEHKAAIIRELLIKLGINSIVMVVGHSMGGHVVGQLAADPALEDCVKSICLLSSAGSRPHRLFSPYWLYFIFGQLIYFAIKLPLIGMFVKRLVSYIVTAAGLRGLTRDAEVFSWYEGSQLLFKEFSTNVERLVNLNIPALCIYSSNDNLVELPVLQDTVQRLGICLEDTVRYDDDGITMEQFKEGTMKRSVQFAKGTHMVHYTYPSQVVKEMVSFLQIVEQSK